MNRTKPKMTWKKKTTDSTSRLLKNPFGCHSEEPACAGRPKATRNLLFSGFWRKNRFLARLPKAGKLGMTNRTIFQQATSTAFLLDRRHLAAALAVALLCLSLPSLAFADDKAKKKKDDHTLLMVSVMSEGGYALPGIAVAVKRQQDRKPKWKGVSDRRGELALRLPVEPATYLVSTHSKNHQDQTRTVEVQNQKRVDVIFRLPIRHQKEKNK